MKLEKTIYLITLAGGLFFTCRHKKNESQIIESPKATVKTDTFMSNIAHQVAIEKRVLSLPKEIVLDTINYKIKKGKLSIGIVLPRLKPDDLSRIERTLKIKLIKEKNRFINDQVSLWDNDDDVKWAEFGMEPVMIYKDENIISYAFNLSYYDNTLMRSYNEYYSVNYNLHSNRLINAGEYFKTEKSYDSLELSKYIWNALGYPPIMADLYFEDIDFSMDDSVVYFFSDQYEFGTPFNNSGGVKKRFISKFIANEFK